MNNIEKKLYDAVIENDIEALSNLLKDENADINFQMENGDTLLHIVKSRQAVEVLISAGIDHTIKNKEGMTAFGKFFEKVYMKQYEDILLSMLKEGVSINAPAFCDEVPVIKLSDNATTLSANIEQLQFLVRNGADINIKNSQGFTPLMIAVLKNNIDMVRALLDVGADTAVTDNKGRTAKDIGLSLIESGYYTPALKTVINDM